MPAADISTALADRLAAADGLPERDVDSIGVLIDAGEWVVALEALCTQRYEYDLDLAPAERRLLTALGERLGVDVARLLGPA